MLKSDKPELERGAAAKTENQHRYKGKENRHHDREGTAGSRKSPASLSPVEILSKDTGPRLTMKETRLRPACSSLPLMAGVHRGLRRIGRLEPDGRAATPNE